VAHSSAIGLNVWLIKNKKGNFLMVVQYFKKGTQALTHQSQKGTLTLSGICL